MKKIFILNQEPCLEQWAFRVYFFVKCFIEFWTQSNKKNTVRNKYLRKHKEAFYQLTKIFLEKKVSNQNKDLINNILLTVPNDHIVNQDSSNLFICFGFFHYSHSVALNLFKTTFIVIQTEFYKSHFFKNKEYQSAIINSKQCWDYSVENCKKLIKSKFVPFFHGLSNEEFNQLNYLFCPQYNLNYSSLLMLKNPQNTINIKNIDLLFVGTINERRKKILDIIKLNNPQLHLVIRDGAVFTPELFQLYLISKYVLNIHILENTLDYTHPIETARIIPALEHNCIVLSEKCSKDDLFLNHLQKIENNYAVSIKENYFLDHFGLSNDFAL